MPKRNSAKSRSRRRPRQQRSVETIEAIFEATARLLESAEPNELTTIRIAEVSGYGVRTIFDYFPNKEAILVAMARREFEKTLLVMTYVRMPARWTGSALRSRSGKPKRPPDSDRVG
jgi:AcrR family transcriptional regulator